MADSENTKRPTDAEPSANDDTPSSLVPSHHPQRDFFIADIMDVSIKDDMASMEHPLFALKAGDMRVRTYERNGNSITIKPGHDGCATIFDKDVWIYCISQLMEAINRGRGDVSRTVRFTAYDFLVATNRQTSGHGYKLMGDSLSRLRSTNIETNIATDGYRARAGFGLVDSWRIVEDKQTGKAVAVEVTLSDWLFRSVMAKNVLTLSPDYFRIRKPIDRRIYELARKHCGAQKSWQCSVKVLHEKCGSTSNLKEFRRSVKTLVESNDLPDYLVSLDGDTDVMTFSRR